MPGAAVTEEDRLDAKAAGQVMRRAARTMGPYRARLWLALGLLVTFTLCTIAGPYLVRYGIDHGIRDGDGGALDLAVGAYVAVAMVGFFVNRAQIVVISQVGEGFLRDMRNRVFDHLMRLSMPFYDREKAGVVVSRMTSDIDSMQELVQQGLLQFVSSILLIVLTLVLLALTSWELLLVVAIPMPFVILASIRFQRDSNQAYLTVRDRIGLMLSHLQEGLSGVRVIQAYGRETVETDRFAHRNKTLYRAHMRSVWIQAWYLPVIELAGTGATALVVFVGGRLVIEDSLTVGTVALFVLSLSNLFDPVQQLSQLFNQVQSGGAGLKKLYELLDTDVDVPEAPDAVALPAAGAIAVAGVGFAYRPDLDPVLRDVDLTVATGERLALVGPTGAGKSTLAKLVARYYDPTDGTVSFGGVDLRRATSDSLRQRIAVVPQEGFLFNGTIRDNVRVARAEASDEEVEAALDALGVRDRFEALPEGLETEVRERGSRLSAGEKQLVSMARAALADPTVLVLDEATSSLDPGTEAVVEDAVERLMEGRTTIVIAHRLSTAARADRVGVVDDGRLVELGSHDELLALEGGRYRALYAAWTAGLAATA
ncbi:ABC transporter ATP-binding protein [Iamia majanohamensis]|uniref:ABC transporter ATP-binding protein n=1 Tax=Iamia majanohamensis TaxID=467976 RepID=A0AAE9Y855_9ACTN|nr:ABC transporter ATP-binding protein [Iamia majanohamensis]WCO68505.1 ABC transporter ATP-binding protein [Iamia majanohamensis]